MLVDPDPAETREWIDALDSVLEFEGADRLHIHPHPTLSETVGLTAEAFEGTITDLYLPKRR